MSRQIQLQQNTCYSIIKRWGDTDRIFHKNVIIKCQAAILRHLSDLAGFPVGTCTVVFLEGLGYKKESVKGQTCVKGIVRVFLSMQRLWSGCH